MNRVFHRGYRLAVATAVLAAVLCVFVVQASTATSGKSAPIVIAVTAPVNSQIASYPSYFTGVEAYAKAVSAAGGFGGRQVKVITCDNQFDPNVMANCARKAVSAHAVAMLGNGPTAQAFLTILQSNHIPWFPADPFTPLEYQSTNTYIVSLGFLFLNTAEVALAVHSSCPSASLWYGDVVSALGTAVGGQLTAQGIKTTLVEVPATATDLSSYVAQTTGSACLVLLGVSDATQAALGPALAQNGHKFQHIISSNALTTKFASQQPSVWNGAEIGNTLTDYKGPTWTTYRTAMKKYYPSDLASPESQQLWGPVNVIGNVLSYLAKHRKPMTSKNVTAALNLNRVWGAGGVMPPVNFRKPVGVQGFPRLVTKYAGFQVVKKGVVVGNYGNKYVSIKQFILGEKVTPGTFGTP
jgi:ABC-type branched-subunit amino acid transport system substrate-binding protein